MSTRLILQRGFSLIELMIGMLIGLLCTLVIATVMSAAEGNRRGTTSGTDAQIAGGLALYGLQRDIASSGYGFASETNAVGCNLVAFFNSVAVPALPPRLAPVFITEGASDTIRTISSSKGVDPATGSITGFTVPVRAQSVGVVGAPGYVMGAQQYQVASALTYDQGDLVVAVPAPNAAGVVGNCELFEINAPVVSQVALPSMRLWSAKWHCPARMKPRDGTCRGIQRKPRRRPRPSMWAPSWSIWVSSRIAFTRWTRTSAWCFRPWTPARSCATRRRSRAGSCC
jgi:type IV pilus assembly protein PilW